ncbi:MAG: DUF1572 domain-containing protein [bacterium]|nr:DUF1572 domain-containing protein [bacterium]
MQLDAIKDEYLRYNRMLGKTLDQVNDDQITRKFGDENNSIAIVLNHLAGNFKSRFTNFLTEDGEKDWRQRDGEFEEPGSTKEELLARWRESWDIFNKEVSILDDNDLSKTVTIRKNELSVLEALLRSVAHFSFHVGQIVILARIMLGENWKTLSIPKGKSGEYNKNPTLEKAV